MLAGLSRHEAKFPGNIFLLIKKMKIFLNCSNWKIQIDVCSANYQFEEIWNIVLRQKLQKLKTLSKVILLSFRLIISPTTFNNSSFEWACPSGNAYPEERNFPEERFISTSVSLSVVNQAVLGFLEMQRMRRMSRNWEAGETVYWIVFLNSQLSARHSLKVFRHN